MDMSVPQKSAANKTLLVLLSLALLVIIVRLPTFNVLLDTDSSVNAFFARLMMRGEMLYGEHHPAHHLPGIYYTLYFGFKVLGDNARTFIFLLLPFFIATAWLVFLIGKRFFDETTGILGAVFFILLSSQVSLSGFTFEMEHFANLPLTATIFFYLVLFQKKATAPHYFWVGMLGAVCILYKITFVGSLAAIALAMLASAWMERGQANALKNLFSRGAAITLGFATPLALVGGYFASLGLWDRLMLVFTFGFTYFDNTSLIPGMVFPKPFGFPLFVLAVVNFPLLFLGLMGAYRLLRRSFPMKDAQNLVNLCLAMWLIFSFAMAGLRGGGFLHYPLITVPPLALVAGIEVVTNNKRWQTTATRRQAWIGACVLAALVVVFFFANNYDVYRQYLSYVMDRGTNNNSYFTYADDEVDTIRLVDYIKENTTPDDYIYVWSTRLQAYYYADRMPPIEIVWPEYVSATGPPERIFNEKTKYVVLDINKRYLPQWLTDGLEQHYDLATVIGIFKIYQRK